MPLMLNLVTDLGELDLTFAPSGELGGFDEWDAHAIVVDISEGVAAHIAALDDVIASKALTTSVGHGQVDAARVGTWETWDRDGRLVTSTE